MKLRSEETTTVSFKRICDALNDFSYKRQCLLVQQNCTSSLLFQESRGEWCRTAVDLAARCSFSRRDEDYAVLNAFISLQIPSPVCFQGEAGRESIKYTI